jgi:hypothetical protein
MRQIDILVNVAGVNLRWPSTEITEDYRAMNPDIINLVQLRELISFGN